MHFSLGARAASKLTGSNLLPAILSSDDEEDMFLEASKKAIKGEKISTDLPTFADYSDQDEDMV
jgi:hypothetical protein